MTREELFARATDPRQYDAPGLDWPREGGLPSPAVRFFHRHLRAALADLRGKSVVDIGCGTGHLYDLFRERGARRVVGVEPSARNAAIARSRYPGLEVLERPLQDLSMRAEFDLAVAVMSFEHQPDPTAAFRRVSDLLVPAGTFILVSGDREFHLTPRFDLVLEAHELPDGSALVATAYPHGTIHDLVRPVAHYRSAARRTGFTVLRETAMTPTRELFEADPRWAAFEGRAVAWLLLMTRI